MPVLAELQMQHPRIVDFVENGQQRALATSDYLSRQAWHKLDLYQHFYGAMGLEDQLVIMMPGAAGVNLGLVFNREQRSFTGEERQMLDLLRPHVALAYRNAQAVTAIKSAVNDAGTGLEGASHGVLRLREDGSLLFHTQRARWLLDRFWPRDAHVGALPDSLANWIAASIGSEQRGRTADVPRVLEIHNAGETLTARLLQTPETSGWMLTLDVRPADQGKLRLPPRLRLVLDQLLSGASEKEIAAKLRLSSHTVHQYVKLIYQRLGVSSRAELMAQFISRP
ncbi:MAG TPA: helix-turn-helix transcriptional regulator [Planctomycetota bacterium]